MMGWTRTSSTRRRRRVGLVCVSLALVAGLAACGGGSDSSSAEFGSEEFGLTFAELVAKAEAVEELIAECMQDAGFEYVANDFDSIRRAMNADKTAPGLSESEFRAEFGFGISTQPNKPIVSLGLGEENAATREGLSSADRAAYDRTLLGDDTDAVFANALEAEDFSTTGGCTREAVEQEFSKRELSASYINPGDQAIDQDQRVRDALDEYAACMKDGGLDYKTPDEVEEDIRAQFEAIVGNQDQTELDGAAAQDLIDLQALELRAADVSFECETEHLEEVTEEVEKEIYGKLPA